MRILFVFLVSLVGFTCFAQEVDEVISHNELNWQEDIVVAKKQAKKEGKPILLFFTGSDWCGPCKLLVKDFFYSTEFIKIATDDLVLYEADFPRRTDLVSSDQKVANNDLKTQYDVKSFPTVILINHKGEVLKRIKGYNYLRDTSRHFDLVSSIKDLK